MRVSIGSASMSSSPYSQNHKNWSKRSKDTVGKVDVFMWRNARIFAGRSCRDRHDPKLFIRCFLYAISKAVWGWNCLSQWIDDAPNLVPVKNAKSAGEVIRDNCWADDLPHQRHTGDQSPEKNPHLPGPVRKADLRRTTSPNGNLGTSSLWRHSRHYWSWGTGHL
jgi:hypothetical protein